MKDFCAPDWVDILRFNGLDSFDALWELKADLFEPPNRCRGGWSGVARVELKMPDGGTEAIFLKRQENHLRRTLRHPLRGEPTFAGEMENILALQGAGVPALEPLFFGKRFADGNRRAILVTRELSGFRSLDLVMREWEESGWHGSVRERRELIKMAAKTVRRMHDHRLAHNALYPKHLFVRFSETGQPEVRLIDLEKMRRAISPGRAARRDLDSLNRRTQIWSRTDRLRFLKAYLETHVLTAKERAFWKYLAERRTGLLQRQLNHG